MKILVTGANGFVGGHFIDFAEKLGAFCIRHVRNKNDDKDFAADISENVDWSHALSFTDCVVHCASLVHKYENLSLERYIKTNSLATIELARQASEQGVKKFVFLSTVRINGRMTEQGRPITESSNALPCEHFEQSKLEAEAGLLEIARGTNMKVVIVRLPLVYGPGVKANFLKMMNWANKSIPLPFGKIKNLRSMIFIGNLTSFLWACCIDRRADNKLFVISDGEDLSTSDILKMLSEKMGRRSRLFALPSVCITLPAKWLRRTRITDNIFGNFQIDSSYARNTLNWKAPFSVEQGLKITVEHYLRKS